MPIAIDDVLGKSFTFFDVSDGKRTIRRDVDVIAYDPIRGWKLAGPMLSPAWVQHSMWVELLQAGLVVPR